MGTSLRGGAGLTWQLASCHTGQSSTWRQAGQAGHSQAPSTEQGQLGLWCPDVPGAVPGPGAFASACAACTSPPSVVGIESV